MLERALTAWCALALRPLRGGVRYSHGTLRVAAHSERRLRARLLGAGGRPRRRGADAVSALEHLSPPGATRSPATRRERTPRTTAGTTATWSGCSRPRRPAPSRGSPTTRSAASWLDERFSCLGAKSALRRGTYRLGAYARLDDPAVTEGLARDLYAFAAERRGFESDYTTYVAVFRERLYPDEAAFERALWAQLQRLHELDARYHALGPAGQRRPGRPRASRSASRAVRSSSSGSTRPPLAAPAASPGRPWSSTPTSSSSGCGPRACTAACRTASGARELRLDGTLNPNLADFGHHSEARQYSGRPTEETWTCPFARAADEHPARSGTAFVLEPGAS